MSYRRHTGAAPTRPAPPPAPQSAAAHYATRAAAGVVLTTLAMAVPVLGPYLAAMLALPVVLADGRQARQRRDRYARNEARWRAGIGQGTAVGPVEITPLHKVI